MSGVWLSIDHAPKDGTPVDLWGTLYDPTTVTPLRAGTLAPQRWTNCRWRVASNGNPDLAVITFEGWWYVEDGYFYHIYPTHFMRIPAGPNT